MEKQENLAETVSDPQTPIEILLPLIRIIPAAGYTRLDFVDEVLAIYPNSIVFFRKKRSTRLPSKAYERDGRASLLAVRALGSHVELASETIASVKISDKKRWRFFPNQEEGREVRIILNDGKGVRCLLPEEESRRPREALRVLFGSRYSEGITLEKFRSGKAPLLPPVRSGFIRLHLTCLLLGILCLLLANHTPNWGWSFATIIPLQFREATWFVGAGLMALFAFIAIPLTIFRAFKYRTERQELLREARRRRSRKKLLTRRPLRSQSIGVALRCLALIFLFAVIGVELVSLLFGITYGVMAHVLLYMPAVFLAYAGYRFGLVPAEKIVARDLRSPVLYLRPFDWDGRQDLNPNSLIAQLLGLQMFALLRRLGPLANFHPLRVLRLIFSRAVDNAEEQMARYFNKIGPFVAIGKPGERFSEGGAARFYIDDPQWQAHIETYLFSAKIVVLQPGETQSVWWEMAKCLETCPPQKILFCLLSLSGRQWRFDDFRIGFEKRFSKRLPRCMGNATFLHFNEFYIPNLLPARYKSSLSWPLSGCALDFQKTLMPFIAALEGRKVSVSSDRPRLLKLLSGFCAVTIWVLLPLCFTRCTAELIGPWSQYIAFRMGQYQNYTGSNGYSLTLPKQWRRVTDHNLLEPIHADLMFENDIGETFSVNIVPDEEVASTLTPETVAESYAKKNGSIVRVLDQRTSYVDGRNWKEWKFLSTKDDSESLIRIAAGPDCTYFIQGLVPPVEGDSSKWWFEFELQIAFDSFKFPSESDR